MATQVTAPTRTQWVLAGALLGWLVVMAATNDAGFASAPALGPIVTFVALAAFIMYGYPRIKARRAQHDVAPQRESALH